MKNIKRTYIGEFQVNDKKSELNESRLNVHLSDAELRFLLHRTGNELAKRNSYGDLEGLDAVARFLLERDGTPMQVSLCTSTELLLKQMAGVIEELGESTENKLSNEFDRANHELMVAEAKLGYHLEIFGDTLAEREGLGVSGLDAVRLYLVHKHGFDLPMLESMHTTVLKKYLAKEMLGWTIKSR